MNSGKTFFFPGSLNKIGNFLLSDLKKKKKGKKRKGDKVILQDYSNSIVIHIPHCLCIVIEGRGEFPKKGKKNCFLKKQFGKCYFCNEFGNRFILHALLSQASHNHM